MNEMLSRFIADIAAALRGGEFSATELMTAALDRHGQFGERLQAYKLFDAERALESARAADQLLASNDDAPPLTGTRYPSKTSTVSTVSRRLRERQGSYAIERELGEGGMATVYLADDIKHELGKL